MRAEPNVIFRTSPDQSIPDKMVEISGGTDLVIVGLREPAPDETDQFVDHVSGFIERLGTVLLVRSSRHFEGATLLFDNE